MPAARSPKPPLITANQLTLLRVTLLPLIFWLLFQGPRGELYAVVGGAVLGCTDFLDGYLARKHGVTVLGGLMDPIADKIFLVAFFIPAAAQGWLPGWIVIVLFARELVVTAARSTYEARGQQLKSSYVARYKTWVQMCGAGFLVILQIASDRSTELVLAICAFAPVVGYAVMRLATGRRWKGASAFALSFAVMLAVHRFLGAHATAVLLGYYIVGITWVSGLGYLFELGRLRGTGAPQAIDVTRLVVAALFAPALVLAQVAGHAPSWAIGVVLAVELAHGGLDNLLAHHRVTPSALAWGGRLVGELVLLSTSFWLPKAAAMATCSAAVALAASLLTVVLVKNRRLYLDPPKARPVPARLGPAAGTATH
jgi:CDP-diacylglycerol--glycerol-3-phosphate 3-phosphatidyltransferase